MTKHQLERKLQLDHDNELIEKCALIAERQYNETGRLVAQDIAVLIRQLKTIAKDDSRERI